MRALFAMSAAVLLSGCLTTAGPDYAAPDMDPPAAYGGAADLPPAAADHTAWWRGFGDARLDALVTRALEGNLDIAAARERLAEARARIGTARARGGPTLDADVGGDADAVLARDPRRNTDTLSGAARAGLAFGWIPDLFGGQRRAVEAAEAEARRRALLRDDLRRQVAADVVRGYLDVARDRASLDLIDASLDLQQQTLGLVRQRYAAGLAAALDVSRAEAQVASTRARRGPLREGIAGTQAALGVLTGRLEDVTTPAVEAGPEPVAVPAYAGGPPIGLPRDLLRARPDVRAAEADLARATAEIGLAEAALYPQLSLPGTLTLSTAGLGTGDVVRSLVATLAATLDIPLFDSGARDADIAAAEAQAREALLVYRATLLNAVAEVETALATLEAARARAADLREAVAASETAAAEARGLYAQGLVGFLDVLDAERTLLDNRQARVEADGAEARAIADLYAAVGAPVPGPGGAV
ncbi:efflux transporter outer membrane subunit [Roseospira marina]|uniref:Efflux transporter outer membrane subunit n=1 Tax=Roseospira marina TaxID=140057 RepID=A0A5M6IAH3_9PROT|nr:efflux transporter outer membrane subunit [Roseospira marina]KAA5605261.1 efflux transporter outer membrane subunit [Roseospira marina]MBB4314721.1 multidrug efflux system outer membrane protein [Roseospira marina]MBB5087710.1 multidrug efflux system outer membrane protein [Roseospira marina]